MKVGLIGYSRVGKTTAAKAMSGWHRFSFAAPLKVIASSMMKCLDMQVSQDDWNIEDFKTRWRPLLVAIGCGMRATDEDYWIRRLVYAMCSKGITALDDVAVDDVRFPNEVEWLLRKKGLAIRIHRPGFGPANDEEARSIAEIDRMWPNMPSITNDGLPSELGVKCLEAVRRFCDESR